MTTEQIETTITLLENKYYDIINMRSLLNEYINNIIDVSLDDEQHYLKLLRSNLPCEFNIRFRQEFHRYIKDYPGRILRIRIFLLLVNDNTTGPEVRENGY